MENKILIPLDDTPFSRQIFPFVQRLFAPQETHINLLRIAKPPTAAAPPPQPLLIRGDLTFAPYAPYGAPDVAAQAQRQTIHSGEEAESFRQGLKNELEPDLTQWQQAGYAVTATVHFGNPADEIADFAKNEQIDVVAMVTHGRTGLNKLFQGSIAEAVLHKLSIPMLLVRAEEEDAGEQSVDVDEVAVPDVKPMRATS
jgi:nucleotide-binding universal stress UspA family protein